MRHGGDGLLWEGVEKCDDGDKNQAGTYGGCTPMTYDGALGGLTGADDKCNTLAMEAGLANAGGFLAWLSADGKSPASRMVHHDTAYQLLDGQTLVAESWTDLTDGALSEPITIDEFGIVAQDTGVWTGTSAAGEEAPPTCKGWTSAMKVDPGLRGLLGAVNETWSNAAAASCFYGAHLICVEQ